MSQVRQDVLPGPVHAVPLDQARGGGEGRGPDLGVWGLRGQVQDQGPDGETHREASRRPSGVPALRAVLPHIIDPGIGTIHTSNVYIY